MISLFRITFVFSKKIGAFCIQQLKCLSKKEGFFLRSHLTNQGFRFCRLENRLNRMAQQEEKFISDQDEAIEFAIEYYFNFIFFYAIVLALFMHEYTKYLDKQKHKKDHDLQQQNYRDISQDLKQQIDTLIQIKKENQNIQHLDILQLLNQRMNIIQHQINELDEEETLLDTLLEDI